MVRWPGPELAMVVREVQDFEFAGASGSGRLGLQPFSADMHSKIKFELQAMNTLPRQTKPGWGTRLSVAL